MMRKLKNVVSVILVFACFLWFAPNVLRRYNETTINVGGYTVLAASDIRVTTANLNLRKGPGTNYSVITVMNNGSTIEILSVSGNWAQVDYNDTIGYAHTAYMSSVQTSKMITTANLNMRTGPSTDFRVIQVLNKGTEVEVISTSKGWAS